MRFGRRQGPVVRPDRPGWSWGWRCSTCCPRRWRAVGARANGCSARSRSAWRCISCSTGCPEGDGRARQPGALHSLMDGWASALLPGVAVDRLAGGGGRAGARHGGRRQYDRISSTACRPERAHRWLIANAARAAGGRRDRAGDPHRRASPVAAARAVRRGFLYIGVRIAAAQPRRRAGLWRGAGEHGGDRA